MKTPILPIFLAIVVALFLNPVLLLCKAFNTVFRSTEYKLHYIVNEGSFLIHILIVFFCLHYKYIIYLQFLFSISE